MITKLAALKGKSNKKTTKSIRYETRNNEDGQSEISSLQEAF